MKVGGLLFGPPGISVHITILRQIVYLCTTDDCHCISTELLRNRSFFYRAMHVLQARYCFANIVCPPVCP